LNLLAGIRQPYQAAIDFDAGAFVSLFSGEAEVFRYKDVGCITFDNEKAREKFLSILEVFEGK